MKGKILVIDDEQAIRRSLRMVLEYEGYDCVEAGSAPEGLESLRREAPDAVLLDIKMPGMDGMEALQAARGADSQVPILMISGHGDIPTAVEAIQHGAYDFLEKPLESERVLTALRNAIERKRLREENLRLKHQVQARMEMIGRAPAMQPIRETIARSAPTQATVLIAGESGTGKELIAWEIHSQSPRADRPFIKVNCAAIPEELIESELFGHEKGAFTGAAGRQIGKFVQADGGTIFLDEVGDMSPRTQAKVLRVLEGGEIEPVGAVRTSRVDVRVIAATNKDLPVEIGAGRFREDLFFRLNVVPITSPPLRERREDIPALIEHFVQAFSRDNNYRPRTFAPAALALLQSAPWRGNVRELRNAVERLLIMAPAESVEEGDVNAYLREPGAAVSSASASPGPAPDDSPPAAGEGPDPASFSTLHAYREEAEKLFILRKLKEFHWNISRMAKAIETPRSNLYKKLEQYGISRDQVQE